ncbi:hypothetical protein EDC96DRAFT_568426 [Choanephora cucurbitarum]|nr:hypothetical protein EDC96DRAFT_568426 [Choanephora cucurbitarum]
MLLIVFLLVRFFSFHSFRRGSIADLVILVHGKDSERQEIGQSKQPLTRLGSYPCFDKRLSPRGSIDAYGISVVAFNWQSSWLDSERQEIGQSKQPLTRLGSYPCFDKRLSSRGSIDAYGISVVAFNWQSSWLVLSSTSNCFFFSFRQLASKSCCDDNAVLWQKTRRLPTFTYYWFRYISLWQMNFLVLCDYWLSIQEVLIHFAHFDV